MRTHVHCAVGGRQITHPRFCLVNYPPTGNKRTMPESDAADRFFERSAVEQSRTVKFFIYASRTCVRVCNKISAVMNDKLHAAFLK